MLLHNNNTHPLRLHTPKPPRRKPTPLLVLWSPFAQQTSTQQTSTQQTHHQTTHRQHYRRSAPPKPPPVTEAPPPAGLSWRLGIQYAELLNLPAPTPTPDVLRRCDALAARPLHPAYAPHVHAGVAALLDRIRSQHNLSSYVNVEPSLLPSVIALLHHAGADDTVLRLGADAMRLDGIDLRRNVALSIALAHAAQAQTSDITQSYYALQKARNVLATVGDPYAEVSRELQAKCAALQPLFVLETLLRDDRPDPSAPTRTERRAATLAMLRTLLLQPSPLITPQYAHKALTALTAEETTSLLNWTLVSHNAWATPAVLRHVALAHMATGVVCRNLTSIKTALLLLGVVSKTRDVFAETLCCHLLLGNARQCSKMLQRDYIRTRLLAGYLGTGGGGAVAQQPQHPTYSPSQPSQLPARDKIVDFVRFESREGDWNIVPGLCLFVGLYINATVLVLFPELQIQGADDALRARLHRLEQQLPAIGFSATNPLAGLDPWEVVVGLVKGGVQWWKDMMAALAGVVGHCRANAKAHAQALGVRIAKSLPQILSAVALTATSVVVLSYLRTLPIKALVTNHYWSLAKHVYSLAPSSVPRTQQFLDFGTAERLVRNWQIAKAHVLGKRRDMGLLNKVTTDPLSSFMAKNTAANAHKGWYFDYRLLDCKVTRVEHDALRDGSIRVVAMVHERCDMRGVDGRKASGYKDRYAVEYRVVPWEDGTWRIKSFDVIVGGAS